MIDMRDTIYRPSWVQSHGYITGSANYFNPLNANNIQHAQVMNRLRPYTRPNEEPVRISQSNPIGTIPSVLPAAPRAQAILSTEYDAPTILPPVYKTSKGLRPVIPMAEDGSVLDSTSHLSTSRVGGLQDAQFTIAKQMYGAPILESLKAFIQKIIDFIKGLFGMNAAAAPATGGSGITMIPGTTVIAGNVSPGTSWTAGTTVPSSNPSMLLGAPREMATHTNIFSRTVSI